MRAWTALLLLVTLGLSLGLGVHPCGAAEETHPGMQAQAAPAMTSCHAHTASVSAPVKAQADGGDHGCCGGSSGSPDHPCPHLCHATALPAVTPPFLTEQHAVTALVLGPVESAFAAPARSIDHVPLS